MGRRQLWCAEVGLLLIGIAVLGAPPVQASETAEAFYRRALESDTVAEREGYLQSALEADPDYAPARAEFGQVLKDNRWTPLEETQQEALRDPVKAQYAERCEHLEGSRNREELLAKWCEKRGRHDLARRHWLTVLKSRPKDRDALRALGLVWQDGEHREREVVETIARRSRDAARGAKEWERRLVRLEKNTRDRDAIDEFSRTADRDAAHAVERRLASLPGLRDAGLASRRRAIGEAFVEGSANDSHAERTASLSRIAIHAPDAELRARAANALVGRPRFDVVPLLLANLKSPIESEHLVTSDRLGAVTYEHHLLVEGAELDQAIERRHTRRLRFDDLDDPRISSEDLNNAILRAQFVSLRETLNFHTEAQRVNELVAAYNRTASESNERVVGALERVTQESLGESPRAWWDYWQRYSGYDVPDSRPIDRQYDTSDQAVRYYQPLPPLRPRHECFVAGTPVWTRTGQQPIESIEAGDLVLARDPHRGDLVFRVVTDTTTREPSPMVAIGTNEETIQATEGHPFWVLGRGWRMARQLEVGDVLSTLDGPKSVEVVESIGAQAAHNLIVESAANYYVGETGVLVHDNTPRRPAAGLVAARSAP